MNLDDAIKAFESPRPNGWFRDDEVKSALEALREKKAREKEETKRPTLEEMERVVRRNATDYAGRVSSLQGASEEAALHAAAELIKAVREDTVPWLSQVHRAMESGRRVDLTSKDFEARLRAIGQGS